jgi:putative endonuclease
MKDTTTAGYFYLAQCGDGSLYAGITTDPEQRLRRHNAGRGSIYVRRKGGAVLRHVEMCMNKSTARRRELEVKSWNRKKKLALMKGTRCTT